LCIDCDNVNFCDSCNEKENHTPGHNLIRIRDSRKLTKEKIEEYRKTLEVKKQPHDSFAFQTWRRDILKDDPRAFELVKEMLRKENEYRLSEFYLTEYKKSQADTWKTQVTEDIQNRVVTEFIERAQGIFDTQEHGIRFLRAASGNFDDRIEELKECANYVKYTHFCVRGELRPGDKLDLATFPLIDPETGKSELLSDWLVPNKPLVIIASSYT